MSRRALANIEHGWKFPLSSRILNDSIVTSIELPPMTPEQQRRIEIRIKAVNRHNRRHTKKIGIQAVFR